MIAQNIADHYRILTQTREAGICGGAAPGGDPVALRAAIR
jgi:hypothetical protein